MTRTPLSASWLARPLVKATMAPLVAAEEREGKGERDEGKDGKKRRTSVVKEVGTANLRERIRFSVVREEKTEERREDGCEGRKGRRTKALTEALLTMLPFVLMR